MIRTNKPFTEYYVVATDTASMLTPYIARGDTSTMLTPYIQRGDTSTMLTNYILSSEVAASYVAASDTAAMLTPYINRSDTASMLTNYIARGDTSSMLTNYILDSEVSSTYAPIADPTFTGEIGIGAIILSMREIAMTYKSQSVKKIYFILSIKTLVITFIISMLCQNIGIVQMFSGVISIPAIIICLYRRFYIKQKMTISNMLIFQSYMYYFFSNIVISLYYFGLNIPVIIYSYLILAVLHHGLGLVYADR